MKLAIKHILFFCCTLWMLQACEKNAPYTQATDSKDKAVVYLQQAAVFPQELTLFPFIDEARTLTLNAGFGTVGIPASAINIKLAQDNVAFDSINAVRQQAGLPLYQKFPADAYTISGMDLTIPAGGLTSNSITVKYFSKKFDPLKSYLLPLSIVESSGYTVNPVVRTVFIVVSKLEGKPADPTNFTATADSEELSGEGTTNGRAKCAIDGNINTYWHSQWVGTELPYPHWLNIDMQQVNYVTKIDMAPRQNNSNGFAKFKLEGSVDGTTWTLLGDNLVFDPTNKSFQSYPITPTPLRYIKITMLEGRTVSLKSTHLAEVVVYKY